ncbi:putative Syntaxin [Quillaja saponaria]|uniref:Syntaxin n=1 Tax=Quillaja saponaria TaxID=32244 RepID=A0AAD7PKR2_QUISA|nr:putative Syntaxin [Quillaja saponaria]
MILKQKQGNSTALKNKISLRSFMKLLQARPKWKILPNLLIDLQHLNEDTKSTHSSKVLRELTDKMEYDMVVVLRIDNILKTRLETLERSNLNNRRISEAYKEGTPFDRMRISITNGIRVKLRDLMNEFQSLRKRILLDHKKDLKMKCYTAIGEVPIGHVMIKMITGSLKVEFFDGKTESIIEDKTRHETVMDIEKFE